jgi:hypothetical protein
MVARVEVAVSFFVKDSRVVYVSSPRTFQRERREGAAAKNELSTPFPFFYKLAMENNDDNGEWQRQRQRAHQRGHVAKR